MAVRNPSAFNLWTDVGVARAGREIMITEYNKAINDQVWTLDAPYLVMSDVFFTQTNTGASRTIAQYKFQAKDMCDEAAYSSGSLTAYFRAYVCSSGGTTTGTVIATSDGVDTTSTVNITAAMTTPQWVAGTDTLDLKTNGDQTTITVALTRGGGAGTVYCAGCWFLSAET
jgi:hypothetical protein